MTRVTAAVARAPGHEFDVSDVDLDSLRSDELLVRIHGVGICHSDLSARDQHIPFRLPAVLGHEGAGVVEAVGEQVTKVVPGDRVLLTFRSCGTCMMCQSGNPAYCMEFGALNISGTRQDGSCSIHAHGQPVAGNFFGQSSFAELAIGYERNVVKVPSDVPLHLMGPLGCGVQTGVGAVTRSLACHEQSSILILGGGSVGLSALLGAKLQRCSTIIVSEPITKRRELALALGATHVIDPTTQDLAKTTQAILPAGVDYAFDNTGRPATIEAAASVLGKRGVLGMVGVPANQESAISLNIGYVVGRGVGIRGIVEGDSDPDTFIPTLINHYRNGELPFDRLIQTYPLSDINLAVNDQVSGQTVKAVLLTAAAIV